MGYVAARRRGFPLAKGVAGGLLLGPLALVLFFLPGTVLHDVRHRQCPYCADQVKADARVCTHCNAILISGWGSRG